MTAVWRVEFGAGTARDVRELGHEPRRLILTYLRQRIATAENPAASGVL